MNIHNALVVFRKELRDMLRDKRTIRSMIIIPVVAFPLLFLVVGWAASRFAGQANKEASTIMVQGGSDSPKVLDALRSAADIQVVPYEADAEQEVSDKKIRALVRIPDGFQASIAAGNSALVSIDYFEDDMKSEMAKERLQKFFDDYRVRIAREALTARGLSPALLEPFTVKTANVAPPSKVGAAIFGGWIPYMIIILSFTGAMYPAMDLTAGEKERGTMETILSSPVSRTDLVIGKFLMVVLASVVTSILSLISMGASFAWSKRSFLSGSHIQMTIDPSAVVAVVLLLLPLAVLFAAVLLAVALLAKSYREAQTYVSPLIFVVIMPAVIGVMPGVELNWKTALIPILNTSLVSKEVIGGTYHWGLMAAVFGMTCLYAGIAISAAVRMFNREDVLFRV
ncbi:MAG TPA: ABC transporter permease [Candidatus Limnocylindrales bacterium]|nr:ABC transporter permease [Candidatus Limnocylindrales bacterium]